MHVLLLEDDLDLGQAILNALRQEGLSVLWHRTAEGAQGLETTGIDAVLLDLGLPQADGMDLLRGWRRAGWLVPVMVISARAELPQRLAGLDGGADDYLPKPFAMAELISRLRALHRRQARQASERWRIGALEIAPRDNRVWVDGVSVELSGREFQLLEALARSPDAVVSKSALGRRLQPLGEPLEGSVIEVHMSNLRRKIGAHRIRTLRGVGYQLIA
ncbi:response regulator transcription factor [Hydrogenophaga pseudoflava]|uniref:response regulator transcription factor n=1 Tax=Hydrogenophaga pseudoflava TaxID=47421 RepID=UPI0027E3C5CC|nr:response regulator transcription factor [Hydrogenophaga pseudoflava]MDQ7745592.1 response regulator transcription factor [Hydrogenophaga pseudoflava]